MGKMIDLKPVYKGEGKVWDKLSEYLPDDVLVYNNREINGREFDFCIIVENLGILVIEVKGWVADKIYVHGVDNISVEGYADQQASPKKQARAYRFAILNKIKEKYNVSPLILDMVCYPFIAKNDYSRKKLDIISTETYTIFKDDLENADFFKKKILNIFQINNAIPHDNLSSELMLQIRRNLEPDFEEKPEKNKNIPYSNLYILLDETEDVSVEKIINNYFKGVKTILFTGSNLIYDKLIYELDRKLKRKNIDFKKNNLYIGYDKGISSGYDRNKFKMFNFELYYIRNIENICENNVVIKEGVINSQQRNMLFSLSKHTMFNIQQFEVEHAPVSKDILVEAGAGTGKTFSMVSRISFLCNKEESTIGNIAEEIAMVTFTNDAATNMKKRLKQMFENYVILTGNAKYIKFIEDINCANISTIHKFAMGIIRNESLYTAMGSNFSIHDSKYKREKIYDFYINKFINDMTDSNSNFINEIPVYLYELKNKLISLADRLLDKSVNFNYIKPSEMGVTIENNIPYFNELFLNIVFPAELEYRKSLKNSNQIDLREILIILEMVLSCSCEKIEELKFKYIFIDEFQDTDDIQIDIFQKLKKRINAGCKLFVVGDLKQSIYRFRGAKLTAFQKLKKGQADEWNNYILNRNYRTDSRLLALYDQVFLRMGKDELLPYSDEKDQLISDVRAADNGSELFVRLECHGNDSENLMEVLNDAILKEIDEITMLMKKTPLSKVERTIAILVRNNWQIENIVKSTTAKGLYIKVNTGGDLFQLPSTLDLYKFILALINNTDIVCLVNFIESNYTDIKLDYPKFHGMSEDKKLIEIINALNKFFYNRMNISWHQLLNAIYTKPILVIIKKVFDALQPWENYTFNCDKKTAYIANYEHLMEKIIKLEHVDILTLDKLSEYLRINILTGQKQLSRQLEDINDGIQIICTTVHKSKGLEYGTVILPYTFEDISKLKKMYNEANYNDNILAYVVQFENGIREKNSNYSIEKEVSDQIAEEARILYVALTRATRKCIWIKNGDVKSNISWGSLLEG